MRKLFKKVLPLMALVVALCCGIAMMTACSEPDVVYEGVVTIGTLDIDCTLTLKGDGKCEYVANYEGEDPFPGFSNTIESMKRTGTWELKDNVYAVTFVEKPSDKNLYPKVTLKSEYNETTKIYTIKYDVPSEFGSKPMTLEYKAEK